MDKVTETIRLITSRPELLVPLTLVVVLVALMMVRRRRYHADDEAAKPGRRRPFRPTSDQPGMPASSNAGSSGKPSAFRQEAGAYADEEDEKAIAAARRRSLFKARIQIIMALISILGLTIIGIINIL